MAVPRRRKVDFLIAGTQKGGTSALDSYLRGHPQVCMAPEKEVHFFDNERLFRFRLSFPSVYHSHFSPRAHHRVIGESTPIYMWWKDACRRIWEYNPGMKFLIILRNPVDRAYSHWNMETKLGRESLSFREAIHGERQRARESLPLQHRVYSYVDRGYYSEQLRRIWRYFPRAQTAIFKSEELREEPTAVLDRVAQFLDLAPFESAERRSVHARPYPVPMGKIEREYLTELFRPEVQALEQTLGWDCSDWLA